MDFLPVLRIFPPDVAANSGAQYDHQLPYPDRQEHDPVTPLYRPVQAESKQQGK